MLHLWRWRFVSGLWTFDVWLVRWTSSLLERCCCLLERFCLRAARWLIAARVARVLTRFCWQERPGSYTSHEAGLRVRSRCCLVKAEEEVFVITAILLRVARVARVVRRCRKSRIGRELTLPSHAETVQSLLNGKTGSDNAAWPDVLGPSGRRNAC